MEQTELQNLIRSFQTLAQYSFDGFALCKMVWDEAGQPVDFVYQEVNPAFERLTGLSREQVLDQPVSKAIPGTLEDHPELIAIYGQVAKTGQPAQFEIHFSPLQLWFSISAFCPAPGYFVALFENITPQKQAQKELEETKDQLASILEHAGLAVALVKDRKVVQVNRSMRELFSSDPNPALPALTRELYTNEADYQRVGEEGYRALAQGKTYKTEIWLQTLQGNRFMARISGNVIDPQALAKGSIWTIEDITEQQAAIDYLVMENNFTQSILEGVDDTLFLFDPKDGRAVRWNSAFRRISGYSDREISRKKAPDDWYDAQDLERLQGQMEQLARQGFAHNELGLVTRSGEKVPTEYHARLIQNETGDGQYILAVGRDLRERRATEKKLQQQQQQAQTYLDIASVLMFALDTQGNVVLINKKGCEILEAEESEILGKNWIEEFLPPNDVEPVKAVFGQLMTGEVKPVEYFVNHIRTKTEKVRLIEWHNSVVLDDQGQVTGMFSSGLDITERDQSRRELERANLELELMEEMAQVGAWSLHFADNLPYFSKGALKVMEIETALLPLEWLQHFPEPGRTTLTQAYQALANQGQSYDLELDCMTGKGRLIKLRTQGYPVYQESRQIGVRGTLQDVTQAAHNKQEMLREKTRAQTYLDIAGVVMVALDRDEKVVMINQEGCRLLGYLEEEILGKNWFENFLLNDDLQSVKEVYQQSMSEPAQWVEFYENQVRTKSGETRLVQWHNAALLDEAKKVVGVLSSGLDVTVQKKVEEELAYSEEQLRTLLSASQDAIITIDQQSRVVFWNEGAARIFGYSAVEMVGSDLTKIMPERFSKGHLAGIARVAQTGQSDKMGKPIELVGLTKAKGEIPVELTLSQWSLREKTYFSGILRDLTERKKTEAKAIRLASAIDQLEEIVFITDFSGHLHYSNPAFHLCPQIFPQTLFDSGCLFGAKVLTPDPVLERICHTLFRGNTWQGEWSLPVESQGFRYFDLTISPYPDWSQASYSLVFVALETTGKRLQQAKLVQSPKLEALGTLASGVAHEINNPISYVFSNVRELSKYVQGYQELLELYRNLEPWVEPQNPWLQKIEAQKKTLDLDYIKTEIPVMLQDTLEGAQRVKEIVQNLKEFSHVESGKLDWTDLNLALKKTLQLTRNELKYKAQVREEYAELPLVFCNRQELHQVFLNLLINAGQAIKDKGEITLRTWVEGDQVAIEITDTGAGIDPAQMERIFEPFFTTKPVGQGTGLGLSISYGIIKKHSGQITVKSKLGQGTSFTVRLPIEGLAADPQTQPLGPR